MNEPRWKSNLREAGRAAIVILGASLFAFSCFGLMVAEAKWQAACNQGDWVACLLTPKPSHGRH